MTEPLENVRVGMTGRKEVVVTRELTVGAHVDGMPFVYGTPMMILAMEIASGEAVRAHLPPGWATVGSEVNIRHLAPTPMGRTVVATARVIEVSGRSVSSRSRRMTGRARSARGRTAAAWSISKVSPSASVPPEPARVDWAEGPVVNNGSQGRPTICYDGRRGSAS